MRRGEDRVEGWYECSEICQRSGPARSPFPLPVYKRMDYEGPLRHYPLITILRRSTDALVLEATAVGVRAV